jgi:hypothetical protein
MSDDRSTELGEEIDRAITDRLYGGTFTGLPGKILKFNASEQTATVQPEPVSYQGDQVVAFPALHDVPVMFPQGGGFRMTWPLVNGDRCWLSFACRPLDAWKAGDEAQPGGLRSHALSDAVAVPMGPRKVKDPLSSFDGANLELLEPTGGKIELATTPRKAAARVDDTTADGVLVFTVVPVPPAPAPPVSLNLVITYTPPGGIPQITTISFLAAALPTLTVGGTITLAGKIDSGSAKVEVG